MHEADFEQKLFCLQLSLVEVALLMDLLSVIEVNCKLPSGSLNDLLATYRFANRCNYGKEK